MKMKVITEEIYNNERLCLKKTYYINLQESPVPLLMADPHTCSVLGV